jgi:hypothetical protein
LSGATGHPANSQPSTTIPRRGVEPNMGAGDAGDFRSRRPWPSKSFNPRIPLLVSYGRAPVPHPRVTGGPLSKPGLVAAVGTPERRNDASFRSRPEARRAPSRRWSSIWGSVSKRGVQKAGKGVKSAIGYPSGGYFRTARFPCGLT